MRPRLKQYAVSIAMLFLSIGSITVARAGDTTMHAVNGVMDLRITNLSGNIVSLNGEWGLYWEQLLTAINDSSGKLTSYVAFPVKWANTIVAGKPLPAKGYASYSLTVLLPKKRPALGLEVPDTYSSFQLYLNGKLFAAAGKPGTSKETTIPHWEEKTIQLDDDLDTLHLVLQVANFHHSKGGPYKEIKVGDYDTLFYKRQETQAYDLLLTGCLFMGGLFFFGLYLFGRHDKVILFFSLFCLFYSYRIIGSGYYVLHTLFPGLSWVTTIHLEYLSLFISVAFFTLYTLYLYPKDANRYIMWVEIWACLSLAAVVIIFPPTVFTQLISPFLAVMFSVIAYAFYVYIKAVRNRRLGAPYALISTAVVLLVFVIINLQYFGFVKPQKALLFTGYISFFFLQSLILSFRFAYTLNKAKKDAEEGLRAKSDFLSNMSHEIRTPLNSVIGISHMLLEEKPRKDQEERLQVLLFSANSLLSIVNDILDYNKIDAEKIRFEKIEMDLSGIARNIIGGLQSAADDKGIELRLKIDDAFINRVIGDPTRTAQVISNLVQNAIKFTKEGFVQLEIKREVVNYDNVTVTVSVTDTGIGIEPEKQGLIFERFSQADTSTSRRFGGTGLGLAICKKILSLQGSSLQLKSEPGKGSTFWFTQTFPISHLALSEETRQPALVVSKDGRKPLDSIRILLVEDNEVNILVARSFLEKWGATIDVARNGQEALDMVDPEKHRIILMDMHMPVMDGFKATAMLRQKGIRLPIIALTANLPHETAPGLAGLDVREIIVKPFVPDDFLRVILHYTGSSAGN